MADDDGGSTSTAGLVSLMCAGPYVLAMVWFGLALIGNGSYPKELGMHYSTDLAYGYGTADFWIGVVSGSVAIALGAGMAWVFIRAARGAPVARRSAVAILLLAIALCWGFARSPGEDRRCFVDGYSGMEFCAPGSTIAVRDFALLGLPAAVAIGGLAKASREPARPAGTPHRG
ncbi:MAG TPA: hypothetical protein VHK88_09635 [Aquihabitans sp.]|jgi:hypothetical protein|nr:hypothetical protein [Aquihabitans sp.]